VASTTAPAAGVPERANSFGRLFGVIFSPKATFQSIVSSPTWLLPVVIGCVLFLGTVWLFGHRGGWPSYVEKQVATNSRFQQIPKDQQRQVLATQIKAAPIAACVEGVIFPFAGALLFAAIFLGVFKGLLGAQFGFKTSLGIVAYAWIPNLISGILGIVVLAIKDPSTVDLQNVVASNASIFVSPDSARWLTGLLGSIDVFSFWCMILLAMGYSATAPKKLSTAKAFAWIFSAWLIFVLAKVGLLAAFAS